MWNRRITVPRMQKRDVQNLTGDCRRAAAVPAAALGPQPSTDTTRWRFGKNCLGLKPNSLTFFADHL